MSVREQVATGCAVLAGSGQGDLIWGHLSARDPDGAGMWIKAAGLGFEEITDEQVLHCGLDGEVRAGAGRRHVEWPIHSQVYLARPDVGAVVHSHAESAVAFAATGLPMTPLCHEGALFSPPDLPRFTRSGDLISTPEAGDALAAVLADRNAVLIPHHGLVTAGPTVAVAVMTALFLEKACRIQLAASATGRELSCSDDAEAASKRNNCYSDAQLTMAWDYLVRTRST
jgi:L-fuculose-phosphate aldolase